MRRVMLVVYFHHEIEKTIIQSAPVASWRMVVGHCRGDTYSNTGGSMVYDTEKTINDVVNRCDRSERGHQAVLSGVFV